MLCIGRSKAFWVFVSVVALLSQSCSGKLKPSTQVTTAKTFSFAVDQVPSLLSGVWYHTKDEQPNKLVEKEFSWGKSKFGYWNALVIDLLNGQQLVEAADGGGDRVTYDIDRSKPNLIHMHLGLSNGPGEEATIDVLAKDEIVFNFVDTNSGYSKMVNGMYYKAFDPGELEQKK